MKRNKYFPRIFDQNGKLRNVYGFKKEKKLVIEIRTVFQKT